MTLGVVNIVLEPELLFPIAICDYHLGLLRQESQEPCDVVGETASECSKCKAERIRRGPAPAASLFPPEPYPERQGQDAYIRDWGDYDDQLREAYRNA